MNYQQPNEVRAVTDQQVNKNKMHIDENILKTLESRYQSDKFDQVVEETLNELRKLLIIKGNEYLRNGNVYHNFEEGAKISGLSREKVLDGFLLKHEISIKDMTNDLDNGIVPSIEKITEKFNDNLIYLLIKKAMLIERANE
jgi:protein tyrosine/serine phosphatase